MKCKHCGQPMRLKDLYMGDDEYGDPIYNEYAFCDTCRIKKNVEHLREADIPAPKKNNSSSKKSTNQNDTSKIANILNKLIVCFAVLIGVMVIFIAILWNRDKIPFINNLLSNTTLSSVLLSETPTYNHNELRK